MPSFTPNFAIPYQTLADPPHGPDLGEDGFIAVDSALSGLDVRVDALEAAAKFTRIAESVLVGTTASVTFSSIPATYRALQLHVVCRSDTAALATNLLMRFNGDTAANYDHQDVGGQAAAPAASELLAQTSIQIKEMTGASVAANHPAAFTINIAWYAGATFLKLVNAQSTWSNGTASGSLVTRNISGRWRSTAAINSITLLPAAGSFIAGSSFALYGLP